MQGARNQLIDLERVSETELQKYADEFAAIHRRYENVVDQRQGKKLPEPAEPADTSAA
jgi:hypothetical protein